MKKDVKRVQKIVVRDRNLGRWSSNELYLYYDAGEKLVDHAEFHLDNNVLRDMD